MAIPLLIFLTAFSLRFLHIAGQSTHNQFFSYYWLVDSSLYYSYAVDILHGEIFLPWQSPLPSYLLAGIFKMTGIDHFSGKIMLAIFGSAACVAVYFLGLWNFDRQVATLAAFLSAGSFGLIMAAGAYNSEVLHGFLLTSILLLAYWFPSGGSLLASSAVMGVLCGLAFLNRGEFALFLPLLLLWITVSRRLPGKTALAYCGGVIAVCLLMQVPNAYRNYEYFRQANQVLGGKIFPEIHVFAPYNRFIFAQSNNPFQSVRSSGRIFGTNRNPDEWEIRILDNPLLRKIFLDGRRLGWEYISSDAPGFLRLFVERTKVLMQAFSFGFLLKDSPAGISGHNGGSDCFTPANQMLMVLHLPLFLLGLWTACRKDFARQIPILLLFGVTLVVNAFFFGLTRYGIYLLPFIFVYDAVGLLFLRDKISPLFATNDGKNRETPDRRIANMMSILVTTLMIATAYFQKQSGIEPRPAIEFFLAAAELSRKPEVDAAIVAFEAAFRSLQESGDVVRDELTLARFSFKLAELYFLKGETDKSLKEMSRTLSYDPRHQYALLDSGIFYERSGSKEKAAERYRALLKWYPNSPGFFVVSRRLRMLEGSDAAGFGNESPPQNELLPMWDRPV